MNENKFRNLQEMVERILKDDVEARNNNNVLYADLLQNIGAPSHIVDGIRALNDHNLPSYEAVTRARRKLVSEHPEYRGTKETEERRFTLYKFYRNEI